MTRNRASAKKAGSSFESLVASFLAENVDDRIERRTRNGAKDRGDISGLRHMGERVVVECKNASRLNLAGWLAEAELERGNDDAVAAMVAHKRHGKADPGAQLVTMTLADLVALLTGQRPELRRRQEGVNDPPCRSGDPFRVTCRRAQRPPRRGDPMSTAKGLYSVEVPEMPIVCQIPHSSRCKRPSPVPRLSWAGEPELACPGCGRSSAAPDQRGSR